jgi:DNA-binding response OmpR family regulator
MSKVNNKIYIIDDKQEIILDGYDTTIISNPLSIESQIDNDKVSLVVVQRELNEIDGIDVVKKIKQIGVQVPVILISSKDSTKDIVYGFDCGCDDYVTKPYIQAILDAKINSIIARVQKESKDVIINNIHYHAKSKSFTIDEKKINLTKLEKKLFLEFIKNNNKILTRNHLINNVWNDSKVKEATISVVIKRLKEKIDPNNKKDLIRSIYGKGYLFVA